jgi:hypothetical protein
VLVQTKYEPSRSRHTLAFGCTDGALTLFVSLYTPVFDIGVVESLDVVVPGHPLGCDMSCTQYQERHKDVKYARVNVDVIGFFSVLMIPYEGGQERRDG